MSRHIAIFSIIVNVEDLGSDRVGLYMYCYGLYMYYAMGKM
jgi:hypothetical protein